MDGLMHVPKGRPSATNTGLGWLLYAAAMLSVAALLNVVWGFIALADNYYWGGDVAVAGHGSLFGWLFIGLGVFQLMIAGLVLMHNGAGMILGILVAAGNAILHLSVADKHPGWALLAIGADVLVIYALAKPFFKPD
jgi:hypothetical protein